MNVELRSKDHPSLPRSFLSHVCGTSIRCQELFQAARSYPHLQGAQKTVLRCAAPVWLRRQMPRRQDTEPARQGCQAVGCSFLELAPLIWHLKDNWELARQALSRATCDGRDPRGVGVLSGTGVSMPPVPGRTVVLGLSLPLPVFSSCSAVSWTLLHPKKRLAQLTYSQVAGLSAWASGGRVVVSPAARPPQVGPFHGGGPAIGWHLLRGLTNLR